MKKIGFGTITAIAIILIAASWVGIKGNLLGGTNDQLFTSGPRGGVRKVALVAPKGKAIAAFAEGCFWTSTHIFEAIQGVDSAISGYAGGTKILPTYEEVCQGGTGHAETVLVYYDPKVISYADLIKAFFASHDATTLDRQGPDVGEDYRSVIFYGSPAEKAEAEAAKNGLNKARGNGDPIITQILPLSAFYRAEDYHQHYVIHHPENPYIQSVSQPRFERFVKTFRAKIKLNAR